MREGRIWSIVLDRARDAASARVRLLRKEEEADAIALPADGLDMAHSLEEVEMDAGLIERCEDRLRAIDDAFNRLKRGRYGICEKCRQEIPIKRLRAVPFAAYCLDCQKKRNEQRRPGEGDVDEPSRQCVDATRRTEGVGGGVTWADRVGGSNDSAIS